MAARRSLSSSRDLHYHPKLCDIVHAYLSPDIKQSSEMHALKNSNAMHATKYDHEEGQKRDTLLTPPACRCFTDPVMQSYTHSVFGFSVHAYVRAYVNDHRQGCSLGLERLGLEAVSRVWKMERLCLISVLRVQRLGLVSVFKIYRNVSVSGLGFRDFRSCEHPCNASGLRMYQEENNG